MSNKNEQVIEFIFENSPEYCHIHATGFWGGINAFGELRFDIVEDIPKEPDIVRIILPENKEEREPSENDKIVIKRIRHVGVTMPMSVVPGLIEWLQRKLDEYHNAGGKVAENNK